MEVRGHLHIATAFLRGVRLTSHLSSAVFDSERHPACPQDAVRTSLHFLLYAAVAVSSVAQASCVDTALLAVIFV